MKLLWLSLVILLRPILLIGQSEPYYQTDFPPAEFQARWEKVFDGIDTNAVAIIQGMPRVNGFIFPRQNNEFYYLCGIETPHSCLLLDGRSRKATLYMPPRNERLERAEGRVLSADDADLVKRITGVNEVLSTEIMREDRMPQVNEAESIYTLFSPAEGYAQSRWELQSANRAIKEDYWDGRGTREENFVRLLRERFPRAEVKDLTPILDAMRSIKSPREIALIRRASQLAGLGLIEAIKSTKPGRSESQIEAAARYVFQINGARLDGYRAIVASGTDNINNMHYYRNNAALKDGDLLLMDYAPDYHYYVSDIARIWPVNGQFNSWQRELLQFVLEYDKAILARIRPGVTPKRIMEEAKEAMEPVFARTTFSKPIYERAARRLVETGGGVFSHPVGMAVHDDGRYTGRGGMDPLKPGQVFAVDPQLRVPEENLYIRYEDVVVVTGDGVENFTDFLPRELDDIEKLVGKDGIVDRFPPMSEEEITRRYGRSIGSRESTTSAETGDVD